MADDIDRANELADLEREAAIYWAQRRKILPYVGRCYNCDEPLEDGIFCHGGECCEDYRKREAMKR
jgi:hypothetical protein